MFADEKNEENGRLFWIMEHSTLDSTAFISKCGIVVKVCSFFYSLRKSASQQMLTMAAIAVKKFTNWLHYDSYTMQLINVSFAVLSTGERNRHSTLNVWIVNATDFTSVLFQFNFTDVLHSLSSRCLADF